MAARAKGMPGFSLGPPQAVTAPRVGSGVWKDVNSEPRSSHLQNGEKWPVCSRRDAVKMLLKTGSGAARWAACVQKSGGGPGKGAHRCPRERGPLGPRRPVGSRLSPGLRPGSRLLGHRLFSGLFVSDKGAEPLAGWRREGPHTGGIDRWGWPAALVRGRFNGSWKELY